MVVESSAHLSLEQINQLYSDTSGIPFVAVPDYLSHVEYSTLPFLIGRQQQDALETLRRSFGEDVYWATLSALIAGHGVKGTTSPNPPVGACILLAKPLATRATVGATQPAKPEGGPHAEVMALRAAGEGARGGTAVVTLEPCNHTGRTGPCSHALVEAGISRVIYLTGDPNPLATGGAEYLRDNGVDVHFADILPTALDPWLNAVARNRPSITVKWAHTLDGFIAAEDRTSQWITGEPARHYVHHDRSRRDAIVVGTGTALTDNPRLSARTPSGDDYAQQPLRVVIGSRSLVEGSHLAESLVPAEEATLGSGSVIQCEDIESALALLWELGARDVIAEGGAGLFASLFEADLVDFIDDYHAPALLGAGVPLLGKALASTMSQIKRFIPQQLVSLGDDVLWRLKKSE